MTPKKTPLSIYIHFPWCERKCPYCDFATRTSLRDGIPQQAFSEAIVSELRWRSATLKDYELISIFIGGGTPSLWQPEHVAQVLSQIKCNLDVTSSKLEVTLEGNPNSLSAEAFEAYLQAGINRFSIGVQSLDAEQLRFLGRLHNSEQALKVVQAARKLTRRVSADLILAVAGQTEQSIQKDLQTLLSLGLEHLSAYTLTIEPNTTFGSMHRKGKLVLAHEDSYAEIFLRTQKTLKDAGFEHYEVSNYAKAGQRSIHNAHYWQGGEYLGLGPAAVGALFQDNKRKRRYRNHPDPALYMKLCHSAKLEQEREELEANDLIREGIMLGLRTQEGLALEPLESSTGQSVLLGREAAAEKQLGRGNLCISASHWRIPDTRWLHLDSIITDLF
ncbi:MAG: radical SAM family heme chaperone HemW [Myxococcales bacterium]|nr:MAG: radical SAM family heme chaperone HemW [Myxococcales bacterium]